MGAEIATTGVPVGTKEGSLLGVEDGKADPEGDSTADPSVTGTAVLPEGAA